MSRVANSPVSIPTGVEVSISGKQLQVKGSKGSLDIAIHDLVAIRQEGAELMLSPVASSKRSESLAGTFRSIINNMVTGVSEGFQKQLELQGVGYRAQAQGKVLNLTLGFSHPIEYQIPDGIEVETPTQTQVVVKGIDNQLVGQVSAEIRAFRPPEPYKGKGVRYVDEYVKRKEAKKK